jgi:hypothetical protein
MFKAASETTTLLRNSPFVSNTEHSAFHTRYGMPVYQYCEQYPEKGTRFAKAMSGWSKGV